MACAGAQESHAIKFTKPKLSAALTTKGKVPRYCPPPPLRCLLLGLLAPLAPVVACLRGTRDRPCPAFHVLACLKV